LRLGKKIISKNTGDNREPEPKKMKIIISAATLYKFLNGKCYHPLLVSADVELALECLLTQWADLLAQPASQY